MSHVLVAGEGETRPPVRASNPALAALMPEAIARTFLVLGTAGSASDPLCICGWSPHGSTTTCPPSCVPETTPWDAVAVQQLLDQRDAGSDSAGP